MYFIGIDGGGTKTKAVLMDQNGEILDSIETKGTNPKSVPGDEVQARLYNLLDHFYSRFPKANIQAIGAGMAGVYEEHEKSQIKQWLQHDADSPPVYVTNDAEIALAAGAGDNCGIVVISGTGSIVYGITREGKTMRAGGWGPILGDAGSGYDIGLQTLQAVMKSYDGIIQATQLTDLILQQYQLSAITELRDRMYKPHVGKQEIAAFAQICIEAAANEDQAAVQIIQRAADELADAALAVVRRHPRFKQETIVLHGSIFHFSEHFRRHFIKRLKTEHVNRIQLLHRAPACGAALLAAKYAS